MSHRTRVIAVGGLLLAVAFGRAQAMPLNPQPHPVQRAGAGDLVAAAWDWLASLLGERHAPVHPGTAGHRHGFPAGQEKEGTVLDPNGHQ
jgi:hypothetical protein